MLLSIAFNYFLALALYRYQRKAKLLLGIGVGVNLGALVYFKYGAFLVDTLQLDSDHFKQLVLPLGISFYTFHSISY
ncbi:MAG: MBOAT family protein, partial [Crocinitomicaceae bacterium]